jgi:hypothetical protein
MHQGDGDVPSCKPSDTRIDRRRRREAYNMEQTCIEEDCCGPDHTSCYVSCPDADPSEASTTAGSSTNTNTSGNGTRMLEESYDYFNDYAFEAEDTTPSRSLDDGSLILDGAGQMCPSAPPNCYEEFFELQEGEQITDPECDEFIGNNLMCDQNRPDFEAPDNSGAVSGSGFFSAAIFVWMGCA